MDFLLAMSFDPAAARDYVRALDLAGIPRKLVAQDAATDAGDVFDAAKSQARVIGSSLLSFAQGVDAGVREAISDSALLAQLVANKHASAQAAPLDWYAKYVEVLQNVGWVMQAGAWSDYTTQGTGAEVHEKIIEVLSVALGPSATAAAIVKSAIDALAAMKEGGSWFTIFSRESQHANIARFQVGLVETGANDDVFVSLLACLIKANRGITQVLFFKLQKEQAAFSASSAKVSINRPSLIDLGPTIRKKVRAYQADYLSSILDL
ncbi:hypothetical protein BE20_16765 [Sorangium cellulosum]|uniref:Uncharacterized protein n=1 Tax=Sorangium cellulosum TaxID=56 RepID=A0A150SUA5_SORCE|nr:hypothetical protein BE20_16765 [Sorangium cellulosum]KYF95807.1 hypothetical protein BE18_46685 [Sorangium cellulosum]